MIALLALIATAEPALVLVRSDDEALVGALALALVDEGVIVTPDAAEATHELTVAARDGGYVITCLGAESKGALIAAGSPGLVEIELRHRAASLVRQTPRRAGDVGRASRVTPELLDRAADSERLQARTAHALLEAGLALAPPEHASERLCVDAGPQTVTLSWGSSGARCEGRPVGLARAELVARVLVGEALRLRTAAPLRVLARPVPTGTPLTPAITPSTPPLSSASTPNASAPTASGPSATAPSATALSATAPSTSAPTSSAPNANGSTEAGAASASTAPRATLGSTHSTTAHMEAGTALLVGVRAGGMVRATAIDARGEASALWQVLGGWGPMAAVDVTGTIAPMLIVEGFSGAGIGGAWDVSDRVRLGVGLLGGVWSHGWRFDDVDAGLAFDPAAIAPAWIDVRVAPAVSLSLAVQAGALGRERTHLISGVDAWSRGPFFLAITGGLTLDIPPSTPPLEN